MRIRLIRKKAIRATTHCTDILSEITPVFEKRLEVRALPDGAAGFFRYKDGNAYEVIVRPAADSDPVLWGHLTKK